MSLDRYRTAIVTGASRGIGAATVRQLCIGGLDVYAVARSADELSELARETGCRPLALDISAPRRRAERAGRARRRHPGQQRLGAGARDRLVGGGAGRHRRAGGCQHQGRAELPRRHGARHEGARAAATSSISARWPAAGSIPGMPVYAMTKAAHAQPQPDAAARPARQRRAGERDRAGPGRDRRASRLARGPRGRPPPLLRGLSNAC